MIVFYFDDFIVIDYEDFFKDPTINSNHSEKPLVPQKALRRLGIDSLYEKSLRYLRKIHDVALDPQADLFLKQFLGSLQMEMRMHTFYSG